MSEIIIYTAKDGHIQLEVNLTEETVWLTQKQLADLFGKNVRTISEHINNIFKEDELKKASVIRNFRITAEDGKTYDAIHYNLDVIISVGYRVKSKKGTSFRQWATSVLKEHLIKGYSIHTHQIAKRGLSELTQTIELLQTTLKNNELASDIGIEAIQLILKYAKTWHLLLAYDEDKLTLPEGSKKSSLELTYQDASKSIAFLKSNLLSRNEATPLFGQEREKALESIVKTIEQTFDGEPLYKTIEEKAAHLLYFIIKDHPFTDGNKRIGSFIFLLYLNFQNIPANLNDNGLLALALLIAQSNPSQKEIMIHLIVNILNN
ncbi:MAG TPA: virulence protein RhuM/Fic/DOC family protein [Alphaproteobacteria bacterium]|nr:virulence protein RhuM/Fic/DOC family protein [Alphaproteobacteria bacterium]HQS94816.1 virulence protein RhuM/Fic/DOC family protein [Alphaproteobacteria bacterium]